ncbi:hypothetical protein [Cohnella faecalis]|uniref:hypothetical protein n=1 Tax=Cohnella faecalis TaxID=2315694 RepID=UPI001313FE7E|nr:hypothetical protein [Cohnella faecalis]
MNDQQWFDRLCETLYTAVISDTLDELGYRNQVMSEKINPIDPNWWWQAGRRRFCRSTFIIFPKILMPKRSRRWTA